MLVKPDCARLSRPRGSHPGAGARLLSLALGLLVALSCGGGHGGASSAASYDPDVARYRLLLRHNPVDPGAAFRCYGGCQTHNEPDAYLTCLAQCPGFEVTKGVACAPDEVPPVAACITARRLPDQEETSTGYKVVAVVANVALIVALGVACSQSSTCGAYYYAPPGQLPVAPGY